MEHDLRVEYRFKNAILYREIMQSFEPWAREQQEKGLHRGRIGVMKFAAKTIGVHEHTLNELLCLRRNPRSTNPNRLGRLRRAVQKIADFLGMSAEELFPESLYALKLPHVGVREFSSPEVLSLQEAQVQHLLPWVTPEGEELVCQGELRKALDEALSTLTQKEQITIRSRFSDSPESLEEIGKKISVGRVRVRQLEAKALRKLRHHSRSDALRKHIDRQMPAPCVPDSAAEDIDVEEEEPQCTSKP